MNAQESYEYAKNILKGRYEDFEKEILEGKHNYETSYVNLYIKNVIKNRWEEYEKYIINSINIPKRRSEGFYCWPVYVAINYCKLVIKGRWEEFENKLLDVQKHIIINDWGLDYCKLVIKGRWEEFEKIIITDSIASVRYAAQVIKGRWTEAEEVIKKDPSSACYAAQVIKGRWIEAEEVIKKDPSSACEYAGIIKSRWKEAEDIILSTKDLDNAYKYAKYIIKDRWKEAEDIIDNSYYDKNYKKLITSKISEYLKDKNYDAVLEYFDYKHFTNIIKNLEKKNHIPDVIKNAMIASCITEKDKNSTQFMKQDKVFKEKMKNFLSDYKGLTVDEVINKL